MSGSVKDQCAAVISVLEKEKNCFHQSCSKEKRDLREENKSLKRDIEDLEETVANLEALIEITDKLRQSDQFTFRSELKRPRIRK